MRLNPYTGKVVFVDGKPFGVAELVSPTVQVWAQATHRWSQKSPPFAQLPKRMRKLIAVNPGWPQVEFDYAGAELLILSVLANDEPYKKAFAEKADVHMLAVVDIFGMPAPPSWKKKDVHEGDLCAEWRKSCDWTGEKDIRRGFAKTFTYRCMPMQTTILTRSGWKHYDEVAVGDEVLTYNEERRVKEWAPLLDKVAYSKAQTVDIVRRGNVWMTTTPNHRWFVKQRREGSNCMRYIDHQIRETQDLTSESNIIVNAPMDLDVGCGYTEWPTDKFNYNWEKAVCQMSGEQRKAFLMGFLLGEGHINRPTGEPGKHGCSGPRWGWTQNRGNIFEAMLTASFIQSDCLVSTYKSNVKDLCYQARLNAKGYITGQRLEYHDAGLQDVWCPVTANGSWVCRQGDNISITGNSLYGGSPKNAHTIPGAGALGMSRAELEAACNRWLTAHPALKAFWDKHGGDAMQRRVVRNIVGLRRVMSAHDEQARFREGINYPIQSLVAAIVDQVEVEIEEALGDDVQFLMQMHDSLRFAIREEVFESALETIKEISGKPRTYNGTTIHLPCDYDIHKPKGS